MSVLMITLLALAILVVGFLAGWLVGGIGVGISGVAILALPILITGFLVGWLANWIIDGNLRKRDEEEILPGVSAGTDISELAQVLKEVLTEREEEVDNLRSELAKQWQRFDQLKADFDDYAAMHPDDLTMIKGIGRIYQWKLRDAGYSTFAQLAGADADQVREVLDIKPWQRTDPQSWIDQAKALSRRDQAAGGAGDADQS